MFLSLFTFRPSYIFIYSFEIKMSSTIKFRLQQKIKEKEEKKQNEIKKLKEIMYNDHDDIRIMKCGDHVNFNFNKHTGKFISITDGAYTIVPKELNWLKEKYIMLKSVNEIGGIFIIKPDEMPEDDYPDAVSFIVVEKIKYTDRLNLKIIVKLNFEDTYIKSKDLLGVIYSNINSFWIILKINGKGEDEFRLVYYYRPNYTVLEIEKYTEEYSYTDVIIKKSFICSLCSTYNITPSVIYIITYDENYNVIILQYTILNYKSWVPKIFLYDTDTTLYDRGKYLSHCVNYNISLFSVILELPNTEKYFYTGIISLSDPNKFKHSEITLEITEPNCFPPNISLSQCMMIIYNIMIETELNIMKMTFMENKKYIEKNKMLKAIKDQETKEKLAKDTWDKLLLEETAKQEKKEKEKREIIKKKQIAENKRIEEEKNRIFEAKRISDINEIKKMSKFLLDNIINNVVDKVTEKEILTDQVLDNVMDEILENVIEKVIDKNIFIENRKFKKFKKMENNIKNTKKLEIIIEDPIEILVEQTQEESTSKEELTNKEESTSKEDPLNITIKFPIEPTSKYQVLNTKEIEDNIKDIFIHNMYSINPQIAEALKNATSNDIYVSILFNNRFIIMYEIDNIVINNPYILKIKSILDNKISNTVEITALYGSYLSIVYSLVLNSIGYPFNPFSKYENPLYEVDIDTMAINFLSDEDMSYGIEFSCEKPTIIAYHTDIQPVQNSIIKTSSLYTLLNNCWDINSTSAILLFEKNSNHRIMRNPDFTDFLFGIKPINLIFGKNQYNLYNPELTEKRLLKAKKKWY